MQATHLTQALSLKAPAYIEYVPAAQLTQASTVTASVASRYVPTAQSVHAAEPTVSLYFPAEHAEHAVPFSPVYPGSHAQAVKMLLPLGDSTWSGHIEHIALPSTAAYVFSGHTTHGPPGSP